MRKNNFLYLICITCYAVTMIASAANKSQVTRSPYLQDIPNTELKDLNEQLRKMTDLRGKVVIVNFWATWCAPCQIEIPHLIEYQAIYGKAGLQVIGIGLDELRKLKNFVRTVRINYPVLQANPQANSRLLYDWGDSAGVLPYTVVVNRQGQWVYRHVGIFNDEAFNTYVKPLLIDDPALTIQVENLP